MLPFARANLKRDLCGIAALLLTATGLLSCQDTAHRRVDFILPDGFRGAFTTPISSAPTCDPRKDLVVEVPATGEVTTGDAACLADGSRTIGSAAYKNGSKIKVDGRESARASETVLGGLFASKDRMYGYVGTAHEADAFSSTSLELGRVVKKEKAQSF